MGGDVEAPGADYAEHGQGDVPEAERDSKHESRSISHHSLDGEDGDEIQERRYRVDDHPFMLHPNLP